MTKKTEVAAAEGGELAIPTDWQAALAESAAETAANVRPASSVISLKSGIVSYQGTPAPDNKLDLVIIDFAQEHTLYKGKYDPDNITSPDCYAIAPQGMEVNDITPADNVPEPVSERCGACPMLEWGSSLSGGRGKACQQRYKLIAIPVSALESADSILAAEVATIKLPVTSGKAWGQYIQTVAALHKRPEWAVVTTLGAKPDPKSQFKATFEMAKLVDFDSTPTLYAALMQKKGLANQTLMQGYDLTERPAEEVKDGTKYS